MKALITILVTTLFGIGMPLVSASGPSSQSQPKSETSDPSKQRGDALLLALDELGDKTGVPRVRYDHSHRVTAVWLNTTFANDENVKLLAQFSSIMEIRISCAPVSISPGALSALSNLNHLERIETRGVCTRITREVISALSTLKSLKTVIIRDDEIEPNALEPLDALPLLANLKVSGTQGDFTDKNIPAITKLSHLTDLDISHTGVTNGCLGALSRLPELQRLTVLATRVTDAGVRSSPLSGKVVVVGARRE